MQVAQFGIVEFFDRLFWSVTPATRKNDWKIVFAVWWFCLVLKLRPSIQAGRYSLRRYFQTRKVISLLLIHFTTSCFLLFVLWWPWFPQYLRALEENRQSDTTVWNLVLLRNCMVNVNRFCTLVYCLNFAATEWAQLVGPPGRLQMEFCTPSKLQGSITFNRILKER